VPSDDIMPVSSKASADQTGTGTFPNGPTLVVTSPVSRIVDVVFPKFLSEPDPKLSLLIVRFCHNRRSGSTMVLCVTDVGSSSLMLIIQSRAPAFASEGAGLELANIVVEFHMTAANVTNVAALSSRANQARVPAVMDLSSGARTNLFPSTRGVARAIYCPVALLICC
jgi:hypothetical protein